MGHADIRFIQALLGHASLETTTVYTRVAIGKLKEIHSATHPAENNFTTEEEETDGRAVEHASLIEKLATEEAEEQPSD